LADHRAKLSYAVALSVQEIVRTSKAPTFDTFTFKDNITDKLEASKRWRRLKARLKRHYLGLRAVGVWQRQTRGAWHFHCVFDRRLDVVSVREWAIECGFGSQLNMRAIGDLPGMKQGWGPERVAKYLTRYVTRDVSEGDPGVRLADYCGDARRATTAFVWGGGIAKLWRLGASAWSDLLGCHDGRHPDFEMFWAVVRLGWETLTGEEQHTMLLDSHAVSSWFYPERYPF
jgi:hypothetical protein